MNSSVPYALSRHFEFSRPRSQPRPLTRGEGLKNTTGFRQRICGSSRHQVISGTAVGVFREGIRSKSLITGRGAWAEGERWTPKIISVLYSHGKQSFVRLVAGRHEVRGVVRVVHDRATGRGPVYPYSTVPRRSDTGGFVVPGPRVHEDHTIPAAGHHPSVTIALQRNRHG